MIHNATVSLYLDVDTLHIFDDIQFLVDGISKFCLQGIFVFVLSGDVLPGVVYYRGRYITGGDVLPGVHTPVY